MRFCPSWVSYPFEGLSSHKCNVVVVVVVVVAVVVVIIIVVVVTCLRAHCLSADIILS